MTFAGQLSPIQLGSRLQDARKARGLTQEAVAEQLGFARTTVVAIEKGQRRVSAEELVRLAALYGIQVHLLTGYQEEVEDFVPQFRKPGGLSAEADADLDAAIEEFKQLCMDYLTLEKLAGVEVRPPDTPQYSIEQSDPELAAEDVAARERLRLGLGDAPVPHLRDLLALDSGLRIFSCRVRPSTLAGMYAYTQRLGGCILVNGNHPAPRRRWSLAHEYAHHLRRRVRGEITMLFAYERVPRHEQFAETFARHFLMPTSGVRSRFREMVGARGDFSVADLCRLAHLYAVSVQAICLRLEELRLIPPGAWDRLEGNKFHPNEARRVLGLPEDTGIGPDLPDRYRTLAVRLYQDHKISEGRLARYLRVDRVEARGIVEEMRRSVDIDESGNVGTREMNPGERIGVLRS